VGPELVFPAIGPVEPHRAMSGSVRGLAWAIADIDRDPDWTGRLQRHLDHLCAAFGDHVRATEGAGGGYAEVVAAAPRLARPVELLARDHLELNGALGTLRQRCQSGAHPADLRRLGAGLLVLLDRHRQRGIDLLYEAYGTDIGGET
jgi:heme oxygenase